MPISFSQHKRCPNCGGFAGAYREHKRCRGFEHSDGEGFFCEEDNGTTAHNFTGHYNLFYYSFKSVEEGDSAEV